MLLYRVVRRGISSLQRSKVLRVVHLCLGLVALNLMATAATAQSYVFSNISVDGNRRIEASTIATYAGIAAGERVSAGQLNAAVQRIVNSGLFESVEVTPRGCTLAISVVEYPTVNRLVYEGNRRLKDDDLNAIECKDKNERSTKDSTCEA